ncbi:MAG: type I methionyl aminopeptidase [Lentisphaeria bacterium]|nr:type I methionyl aminopeptidase [Lentisphaeria bacterium]
MPVEHIHLYGEREVEKVRLAGQAAATVLDRLSDAVQPGMSTLDLDNLAECFIREVGGKSGSLNYHGFPRQVCISLNDEVVHGIGRADRIIQFGDLVKLDVVVELGGYYGDNARTVCAGGAPDLLSEQLMAVTKASLEAGIDAAVDGATVNDVSTAVQRVVETAGFSCVRDMVGHGCGKHMHEPPEVPNFRMRSKSPRLVPGMIICIEPMVNVGDWRIEIDPQDRWTCRTLDHSLSAHFENQILITKKKPEILTVCPKNPIA